MDLQARLVSHRSQTPRSNCSARSRTDSFSFASFDCARVCVTGSGKTSVGRLLAESLGRPFVDVDDDVLEVAWGTSVAERLRQLGDEAFVQEEGRTLMQCKVKDSVMALSGSVTQSTRTDRGGQMRSRGLELTRMRSDFGVASSNPLHPGSLEHVAKDGLIVYLDIEPVSACIECTWLD